MADASAPLPANVLDALRRGNTVEAIKLLRASTGLGLKEAKDVIDAHLAGRPPPAIAAAHSSALPPAVIQAVQQGNRIEAIRRLRDLTGLGLKEAKDAVEAFEKGMPANAESDSPGRVRDSRSGLWWVVAVVVVILIVLSAVAHGAVGLTEIAGKETDGPVTVFYPSSGEARALKRGPFSFRLASQGAAARGNGRLVVISHGSGGSPWAHMDLARTLVEGGFVVALPEHRGDNYKDDGSPGPGSWKLRPAEVSRAIDAIGADARFTPLVNLDRVGMYGMSAGGHTALSLAGGRWSPAQLLRHCEAHIAEDFQSCVGLTTRLTGGPLDGLKKAIALAVIRSRLDDARWYEHTDPRIAAVVAGVPFAADFDMASLAAPRVPLALVTARQDKWLVPRFHGELVLAACTACERIADFPSGGHGALLSPLPPGLTGLVGELMNDPPGFDRSEVAEAERRITAYFRKHLLP